jgi:hypothetical protein
VIRIRHAQIRRRQSLRAGITIEHSWSFDALLAILASLALESVMRLAARSLLVIEELTQTISTEMAFCRFVVVDHTRRKSLFVSLSLEDLFLQSSSSYEAIDETVLLLPVSPHSSESLLVGSWIPVWVEEHKPICADEIDTASSCFTREKEDKLFSFWIVELINQLLPLLDVGTAF